MTMRPPPVGLHGIALRSNDPALLAKRCRALLGLPVLSRSRNQIVLGRGPELFLAIRRGTDPATRIEEIHVAVERIESTRRRPTPDSLGGDSWTRSLAGGLSMVVREFKRPPSKSWRKRRPRV